MFWVAILTSIALISSLPLYTIISTLLITQQRPKDPIAIWKHIKSSFIVSSLSPPFGSWLFSFILGFANPYSRSMKIRFTKLDVGIAEAYTQETNSIRNPFKCIHAVALTLLAETVGGLALFTTIDSKKDRAIVTKIESEYFKKSRGRITAKSQTKRPKSSGKHITEVDLLNSDNDIVAKAKIHWTINLGD